MGGAVEHRVASLGSENFCRYCYASNNPYTFTDPDGRDSRRALPFVGTQQNAGRLMFQGRAEPMRVAGQRAGAAEVVNRTSINAVGTASMGTGINAEKNLAGNGSDKVGWVAVGQGAYAGVVAEFSVLQIDLVGGASDSPFSFDMPGDIGAVGSIGGGISLDPGGKLEVSVNLGLGIGAHASFAPTLNVEVNNSGPPVRNDEEMRGR